MNRALSFQELTETVQQMEAECVPGIDTTSAISSDIMAHHWTRFFFKVIQNCFTDGVLPKDVTQLC